MSQDPDIRIGVAGALGRMGRAVAAAVDARPGLNLCALFDHMGAEAEPTVKSIRTSQSSRA